MNILHRPLTRRSVVKGLGLTGLAGLLARPRPAAAADRATAAVLPPPVRVFVSGADAHATFVAGANSARPGVALPVCDTRREPGFLQTLQQQLRAPQPVRVIGLVDDASAAQIVEVARSAGAQLHWLGQHASEAGGARHHLLGSAAATPAVAQWSRLLEAGGQPFELSSPALYRRTPALARTGAGAAAGLPVMNQQRGNDDWAASLGFVLATLGAPEPAASRAGIPTTGSSAAGTAATPPAAPLAGRFVSFSITTANPREDARHG